MDDNIPTFAIQYRGVEQLVARRAHNPKVAGSSPAAATKSEPSQSTDLEGFFVSLLRILRLRKKVYVQSQILTKYFPILKFDRLYERVLYSLCVVFGGL